MLSLYLIILILLWRKYFKEVKYLFLFVLGVFMFLIFLVIIVVVGLKA